jgi:hypothetical protein
MVGVKAKSSISHANNVVLALEQVARQFVSEIRNLV